MTIGGNLKKLRVAQGLTQDQLAEKLHVTRQAVSNWERNVSHPDLDQLEAIAAALGVEVTTLLYGPPQNADAKIATAVPVAVMLPICVPENPICLRYCPIIGVSAPIAIYVK